MESQPNLSVPNQNNIDLSKMTIVCKIDNGFFHQFGTQKLRQLVDICHCEILQHISIQGTQVPSYYIKIGTFVQSVEQCIFVKAKFQTLLTFVFQNIQNQNCVYLLSFQIYNPTLQAFCQAIKQAAQVIDYKSDSYGKTSIKQKIDLICEGELTQQMIQSIEYIGNVLKTVGTVFGAVSKNIVEPAAKAETIMLNGFNLLSQKMVSEENKQRWSTVKQTASTWNEKMTEMYKPIDNAFKLLTSSISSTFNNSDNKYVKTIKKFSLATAATLNNSYKRAETHMMSNVEKENQSVLQQNHEISTNNLND